MATYVGISKLYITQIRFYLFFRFTNKVHGKKTEKSDVTTYGGIIHVYIFLRVRFEQSTVATYGGISKLYITQIRFYLFFHFTDKVREKKLNNLMWVRMAGEFMSIYIYRLRIFG